MSTAIFDAFSKCEEALLTHLKISGTEVDDYHDWPWRNYVFESGFYRRAHLDAVQTDDLYMFHLCVFPHIYNPAPIYGVDVIAGKKIVSGGFHDFSKAGNDQHYMMNWFQDKVEPYEWSNTRELPEWAQNIFSPGMIAVSRTKNESDYINFVELAQDTLVYYLSELEHTNDELIFKNEPLSDYTKAQNWYCYNQKQNPHTPRVMGNFCNSEETVHKFIHECLFPEI